LEIKHTEEMATENVIYCLLGLEYPMEQCFHFTSMWPFSYDVWFYSFVSKQSFMLIFFSSFCIGDNNSIILQKSGTLKIN
jgi:hypothetical protein